MARLRVRRLPFVGDREGARRAVQVRDALPGGEVGSAADFDASGTDAGGGAGPHGRDAGRIALPSDAWTA